MLSRQIKTFSESWETLLMRIEGYSIRPPKKDKPTKQAIWCTRILRRIVWHSGCLDYCELPNIPPKDAEVESFAKGTEKCKILGNLMHKEVEILNDHGRPKVRDLVDPEADEEMWI